MEKRNQYLEDGKLFFESDTHEWFNDKGSTTYAQTDNGLNNDALPHIMCFVVRDKSNGSYERVVMDKHSNEVIFATGSLEDISGFIDKLKIVKRFEKK